MRVMGGSPGFLAQIARGFAGLPRFFFTSMTKGRVVFS
jgi:hypothetical protein